MEGWGRGTRVTGTQIRSVLLGGAELSLKRNLEYQLCSYRLHHRFFQICELAPDGDGVDDLAMGNERLWPSDDRSGSGKIRDEALKSARRPRRELGRAGSGVVAAARKARRATTQSGDGGTGRMTTVEHVRAGDGNNDEGG